MAGYRAQRRLPGGYTERMPVTLRSHAKINLGLAIGPVRPDGFHALATVYQTVSAHDLVTVEIMRRGNSRPWIELTCNDPRVPRDSRNTVCRMLSLALDLPGREHLAARVHIDKRLPVQGGLGAGSANAVAALAGLERRIAAAGLAPALTGEQRLRLAAEVGSDVPLFLLGGAVLGLGRGENVVPLQDLPALSAVIALPDTGVSTPAAFRDWDRAQASLGLTPQDETDRLSRLSRALAAAWCEPHTSGIFAHRGEGRAGTLLSSLVQTGILLNDFEQVVFRQHPFLETIKRSLAGQSSGHPAVYAALSGSGSAVFGLYADQDGADAAGQRLNTLGVRALRAQILDRPAYWSGMVVRED